MDDYLRMEMNMETNQDQEKTNPEAESHMGLAVGFEVGTPSVGQVHNLQACNGVLHFEAITKTQ